MFKIIAIAIVVVVVAVLSRATKPDTFRVSARRHQAPPEKIFRLINDLQSWSDWSPWEKKDPGMKKTHGGPASGAGATYAWEGNQEVGKGRMEITETSPPSKIVIRLDFVKPFEAHNIVEFALEPKGDATDVTWAMHGPMPYISKIMTLFFSMDKMVGKDFEAGLASLKALAEK
jgi:uncharacterized protein YndB with AHSA1/START domain